MELVYLWVDNYKNIRNQGFNFSPKFECEFKAKYDKNKNLKNDCELKITPKEYLENFFGKDINVTAIVGENGSGKSSILNFILELLENNDANDNNYILIVRNNNENFNISNFLKKDEIKDLFLEKFLSQINFYSYSNILPKKLNAILLTKEEINNHLMGLSDKKFKLTSFMYLPKKVKIKFISPEKSLEKLFKNDNYIYYTLNSNSNNIGKSIEKIKEEFEKKFLEITDNYEKFLVIIYLKNKLEIPDIKSTKTEWKNELKDVISEKDFVLYFKDNEKKFSELSTKEKEIYIKYMDFFDFDFIDEKNRRYSDLSHGEQVLFGQMLNIYSYSLKQNTNLIFLFDEPEVSLHPNWQKKYIQELFILTEKLKKNYHFIFASHSPYILSDIPKENVIFLEKYKKDEDKNQEEGNCKNVSKDIDIKPFGANIHTLLSHGFFMKDGLMGEFAKSKINEIKEFYEKVKKSKNPKKEHKNEFDDKIKKFNHIQSIIGEPFLQTIIKNYLDELEQIFDNDIYKNKKRNNLLKQFSSKELEEYLESLKNAKN